MVGRGHEPHDTDHVWPYVLGVHFDAPSHPIFASDGAGRAESGGFLTLQRLRDPGFATHVRVCGGEWLVAMAEEEEERGVLFTPEEIYQRWIQLSEPEQ